MTFDEWFKKEYEPTETCLNDLRQAFEAGLHADVHTDNSKVIAELEEKLANADYQLEGRDLKIKELEQQIEKMKWHKVADGDVPKNERWVCNQDGCYCYYDVDTEQWLDTEGTRTKTIEWCDMPTKEIKE